MCFNKELTGAFTLFSVSVGLYVVTGRGMWKNIAKWRRLRTSLVFFYFALMEGLQFVQYLVIDDCESKINNFMTQLGWYHIAWQPLFSNFAFSALDAKSVRGTQHYNTWNFILWFSFIVGLMTAARMFLPALFPGLIAKVGEDLAAMCTENVEGVCGPITCTYTGVYHLRWTFKMIKPTYIFPSLSLHFLNMFVAPILQGNWIGSVILFLTGPFISLFFDPISNGERASIWCFFSIAETVITAASQYYICKKMGGKLHKE